MDGLGRSVLGFQLDSSSPHFELFKAAYAGKLNNFKSFALNHAEKKGVSVGKAIGKLVDGEGKGCLHHAAGGASLNVCKYLLEKLKLDVDSKDHCGRTPLLYAIREGHLDTVRYLLEKGANADASDDICTPLHCAATMGNTKIIALLLSEGVRVDAASMSGTALLAAAAVGHQDAVKVLLGHGANPNVVPSQGMLSPLISSIFSKSWESVELLLQAGADPNALSFGNTPLVMAARYDRADVITRLLEAGADPNYKNNLGLTALEKAALFCNYQTMGVLFPVTFRIPTYPDWSIPGLVRHVNSDANKMQRKVHEKERFHQAKSKGRDAFQGEQYLLALSLFEEAMAIFPKDAAVLSNLSACYARMGNGISALNYATKCMHQRPEWPKAYYRLGVALNICKRYNDAAGAFSKGLTLDPENK